MFKFPYLGFPYNYSYYNYYNNLYNENLKNKKASIISSNEHDNTSKKSNTIKDNNEQPIFEILGISLFFDDIIILCLLYFLYQEDVKDYMLYIILFLLLFS